MTPNSTSKPELDQPRDDVSAAPPESETPAEAAAEPTGETPVETTATGDTPATVETPVETTATGDTPATVETPEETPSETTPISESPPTVEAPVEHEEPSLTAWAVASPAPATSAEAAPASGEQTPTSSEATKGETLASHTGEDDLLDDGDDLLDEDEDEIAAETSTSRYPTLVPLVGALVGLVVLASLLIAAFALPASNSKPTKLPIGVAGSQAINTQLKALFAQSGKTFKVSAYPNEAALRSAIEHRKVYGGLSVTQSSATMLVSTAASPVAAEALGSVAGELSQQTQVNVSDVVPAPKKDPRGTGLASLGLPLLIGSMLPALVLVLLYRRRIPAQVGVATGAAVLIGGAIAAVLTFWLGATDGANFWLLTLGLTAGVLATSLVLLGLSAVGGRIGLGIGVAALVLIAAPLSGLSSAPEWLPHPWGSIGQLLPPGASATLLRSTAFFDGHGGGTALLVLAVWALAGLLLLGVGEALHRSRVQAAA